MKEVPIWEKSNLTLEEAAAYSSIDINDDGVYWLAEIGISSHLYRMLPYIITLLVLAVLFALAVVWISKNGGWKGEGCGGNCASCHSRCENPEHKKP